MTITIIRPSSDVELMIRAAVVGGVDVSSSSWWLLLTGWLILDVDTWVEFVLMLGDGSLQVLIASTFYNRWLSDLLLVNIILYPQVPLPKVMDNSIYVREGYFQWGGNLIGGSPLSSSDTVPAFTHYTYNYKVILVKLQLLYTACIWRALCYTYHLSHRHFLWWAA